MGTKYERVTVRLNVYDTFLDFWSFVFLCDDMVMLRIAMRGSFLFSNKNMMLIMSFLLMSLKVKMVFFSIIIMSSCALSARGRIS